MKAKRINIAVLLLNKQFGSVSENIQFAVVIKTKNSVTAQLVADIKTACQMVVDSPEDQTVSCFVKMPFERGFASAKNSIGNALKSLFPEFKAEKLTADEQTDIAEIKVEKPTRKKKVTVSAEPAA